MTKVCNIGLISVRYNLVRKVCTALFWPPKIPGPSYLICSEITDCKLPFCKRLPFYYKMIQFDLEDPANKIQNKWSYSSVTEVIECSAHCYWMLLKHQSRKRRIPQTCFC